MNRRLETILVVGLLAGLGVGGLALADCSNPTGIAVCLGIPGVNPVLPEGSDGINIPGTPEINVQVPGQEVNVSIPTIPSQSQTIPGLAPQTIGPLTIPGTPSQSINVSGFSYPVNVTTPSVAPVNATVALVNQTIVQLGTEGAGLAPAIPAVQLNESIPSLYTLTRVSPSTVTALLQDYNATLIGQHVSVPLGSLSTELGVPGLVNQTWMEPIYLNLTTPGENTSLVVGGAIVMVGTAANQTYGIVINQVPSQSVNYTISVPGFNETLPGNPPMPVGPIATPPVPSQNVTIPGVPGKDLVSESIPGMTEVIPALPGSCVAVPWVNVLPGNVGSATVDVNITTSANAPIHVGYQTPPLSLPSVPTEPLVDQLVAGGAGEIPIRLPGIPGGTTQPCA